MKARGLLVAAACGALAALAAAGALRGQAAQLEAGGRAQGLSADQQCERAIFFAVLEGLYADGVASEDAAIFVASDELGRAQHFVPGCPICTPAVDAVNVYLARPPLRRKVFVDTFGPGLGADERAALRSPFLDERVAAIEGHVARWMERYLERMRLSPEELSEWQNALESRRKTGMAMLFAGREAPDITALGALQRCAFCDGANAACAPGPR